jgi:adenylate cyclase
MEIAAIPEDELDRLSSLYELNILDTPPDERFDRITRLATSTFDVPIAYVSLIDANRQWYKSSCGLKGPGTGRDISLCSHAILQEEPLVIYDTHLDFRFADNPLVTSDPFLRFYAGCPLKSPNGFKVATLCIADREPRKLSVEELKVLIDLAHMVEDQLKLVDITVMQRNLRALKNGIQQANDELAIKNKFIREVFGRYMTDEVANQVLQSPEALMLGGEKRVVTILMCDVRGFTTVSEKFPPEVIVELLNSYLEVVVDVVGRYEGTVDSFIGDGMLVTFGAPIIHEDDPARAVACAIEMQNAMQLLNKRNIDKGLPVFDIGIGINTGEVVAGNIGSQKRMKYSVIGSAVNIAARIESLTLGGQILISDSTLEYVRDITRVDGKLRVKVKGLGECVHINDIGAIGGPYNVTLSSSGSKRNSKP